MYSNKKSSFLKKMTLNMSNVGNILVFAGLFKKISIWPDPILMREKETTEKKNKKVQNKIIKNFNTEMKIVLTLAINKVKLQRVSKLQ